MRNTERSYAFSAGILEDSHLSNLEQKFLWHPDKSAHSLAREKCPSDCHRKLSIFVVRELSNFVAETQS